MIFCPRKGCDRVKKIVPKAKLSKKVRRKLNAERRTTWAFSPVTKRVESKKVYNRKKISRTDEEDGPGDSFLRYTGRMIITTR